MDRANHSPVISSPSDSTKSAFAYIILTNKAIAPSSIPPLFSPVISNETTFAIIQNGVGNEEPFRAFYPSNTIISCVTWVGASQPEPGLVKHWTSEDTQMGLFPNPELDQRLERERLEGFAALLRGGGTKFSVEQDIQVARWEKVVWNCAWNALTTLTGCDTQAWLHSSPEADATTRQLMLDVITVGRACGIPLEDELVERLFEKINAMPGIYSSMYVDSRAGRPLEVDVILGFPMRKARELRLEVPTLRAVFAMVGAVDGRLRKEAEGKGRE